MSRTSDVARAIEEIRNTTDVTESSLEQMKVGLLGHIAVSLAVIADRLTEEAEGSEASGSAHSSASVSPH